MSDPAISTERGREVCKRLGLDPFMVRDVTINFPLEDCVSITVEMIATKEQVDGLLDGIAETAE